MITTLRRWIADRPVVAALAAVGVVALVAVGTLALVVDRGGDDRAAEQDQDREEPAPSPSSSTTTTSVPVSTTTEVPSGEIGRTAGANRDLAPGVTAQRFDVDPPVEGQEGRTGRIHVAGPGGVTLVGSYWFVDDQDWVVTVDGAEGALGGVAVGEAAGEIASTAAGVTADVTVALPDHPRVVPAWDQAAALHITHVGGSDQGVGDAPSVEGLAGDVVVSTSRGDNAIALRGPVVDDGSYVLAAQGHLRFAGSTVSLAGSYHGRAGAARPDHRWAIGGVGDPGAIGDVPVTRIAVAMTEAAPGVTGTAELTFAGGGPLRVGTGLAFVDEGDWELTAWGASARTWSPASMPGLTAATDAIGGAVTSTDGAVVWGIRSPMRLVDEALTMTGTVTWRGLERVTVEVTDASGSVLGVRSDIDFGTAQGKVQVDGEAISGAVLLTAQGELLVDLPDGWVSNTELWLRFTGGPGGSQTASHVTYSMVNGASRLQLKGVVDSSSAFALDVSGALRLAQGSVPFGGSYRSAGYVVDGVPLPEPTWELSGAVAQAQGGSVPLGHGAALVGGSIGLRSQGASAPAAARSFTPAAASSFSGEVEVQLSQGDPFTLVADLDYVDDDDWSLTVRPAESGSWTPPGMVGLTIDLDSISGAAVSEAGEVTWSIDIGEAVWENITTGVTLTTGFSISEDCPLDEHCPDAEGLFVGFHDGELTFPDAVPDMALGGAFLTDGSWARFEARPDDVTFNGIELADTAFTMWKGPRSDTFDPNLEMPDLRASNNDFGLEFCGSFRVDVPDVATIESGGCASWSPEGVVLAQVGTGGDIESGESNGVRIGNVTLEGYAWTDLETEPVVTITGIEVPLGDEVNQLAATMHIPADLMKATGNADADATIAATGWFGGSDFSLDGAIDVSMRSGGFTLDRVSVHIGKDGDQFSLGLGADATVSMSGNHFPVSAYVGVETGGGSNEIVVRLSAQGAVSEDPNGGFELPTLLPSGTFEPDYAPMIDGAFDSKPASSLLGNGDFEDAVDSENLFTNGDFEAGAGDSLFPEGDFEGGAAGNLLANGDFEDTDVAINGDFETGDAMGWPWSSGYAVAILPGVTAPTDDEGATALELRNTQASGTTSTTAAGLFQNVAWPSTSGATYTMSVWARTPDGGSRSVALFVEQKGTAPGCSAQATATTTQTFTVDGTWRLLSLPVTGVACRAQFTLVVNPVQGGAKVHLDALRFELTGSPTVVEVPGTERPWMRSTTGTDFGALPPITRSSTSNVVLASDYGNPGTSLSSNGNGRWWQYNPGTYGDVSGDFDLSYDVYFPNSKDRDILNLGFWLTGSGSSPTGYAFRVQTANDDSGFYSIKSGSKTRVSGDANFSPLVQDVWHRVRLTAVGSYVTATITRVDTGEQIYRRTMTMPAGNRAGVFGQVSDGRGAGVGHRIDNFHVLSAPSSGQAVRYDPGSARSGNQYLSMRGPSAGWSMLAPSGEAPEVGQVYTFTGWARSSSGTLTGTVSIETEGGAREVATTPFAASATAGWVRVRVTLPITKADHTGLRVGFTGISPANVELQVDDLVLQEVGWQASPTTPAGLDAVVIDDGSHAHSGLGSLLLVDRSSGTSSLYRDLAAPQAGATYTASAWLYSPSSSNAALRLTARGGTEESNVATFATTSGWRQYSVTLPVTRSGHSALRLAVEVRSASGSVYVDDIVLSATGNELPQTTDTAWTSSSSGTTFDTMPPISRASDVNIVSDFGNPGASLRSDGSGSWWQFNTDSYGYTQGDFDVSYDVYFPATSSRDIFNLGFWLTGAGATPTGYTFRVQSDFPDSGFYAVKSGGLTPVASDAYFSPLPREVWHRVRLTAVGSEVTATVVRTDTGEQVYQRTLTMPAGNRAGVFGQVSDGAGASVGHRVDNFVVSKGTRAPTVRVLHDPAGARTGSAHLQLTNGTTASGSMARTVGATPTPGATYVATAWVRAPGAAVSGALTLSTGLDSVAVPFVANGQWQEVAVELPITKAGATGLTMTFDNKTAGASLDVDDLSARLEGLTQPNPWIGVPGPGGSIATAVWSDPALAHGGNGYLEVQTGGGAGRVVSTAAANPAAGSQQTASAWVRSPSGAAVQGVLELVAEGGGSGSRRTPFTATGTWQQVYVTLPITQGGTTALRTEVEVSTPGQALHLDDVALRPVPDWAPFGPTGVGVDEVVVLGSGSAASGPGHLRVRSTGAGGGVTATTPATVRPGGSYTMQAYVRSSTGAPLAGALRLTAAGAADEAATSPFTADGEWRHVELTLAATRSNTALVPAIELTQAGELDLDQITITQDVIVQDDPWTTDVVPGGSVDATVYEDPARAHDSSGLLVVTTTGPAGSGVSHALGAAPTPGTTYAGSAWVRSSSGTPVQGLFRVATLGGTPTEATAAFTADGTWRQVSVRLPITGGGHTGLRASLVIDTPGVALDVDDVKVQREVWTPFGADADQIGQTQVNDGERAESGNGYLQVTKATGAEGGVQLETPGALSQGTSQTVSAYVRSSNGAEVPGRLRLVATGGATEDVATTEFRAGPDWRKITVTLPVAHGGQTALRSQLLVDAVGVGLDVDSVTVGQEPLGRPDGVTNPLPHPERGYAYLWSDAFGIKGAHLWSLTAQIQVVNGSPGLGVGGTVYFDPTAMPGVMTGTEWLKGDMTLNISRAEPCLSFGFDGTGTDTRVEIDGGVFSTSKFELGFAPRGCEVGDRVVPVGSSLAFDTELGDASIHLDLEIGRDDADLPTFYADVAVHDLVLAGTRYDTMSLLVDVSAAGAYVGFVGDFTLPMGKFSGDFELSVNADLLHMEGDVSVEDWKMAGGGFDIDEFSYRQVLDVPFGAGACASFSAATDGRMSMGGKRYVFDGSLALDCGVLRVLHIEFDYMKRNVAYGFEIDYDAGTRMLAGGIDFKFERKTSWKFFGKRYRRHPKFQVALDFAMNVDKPSSASLRLFGKVSVSGGSGSLDCSLNSGGDDGCSIYVRINRFGGHTYRSSW